MTLYTAQIWSSFDLLPEPEACWGWTKPEACWGWTTWSSENLNLARFHTQVQGRCRTNEGCLVTPSLRTETVPNKKQFAFLSSTSTCLKLSKSILFTPHPTKHKQVYYLIKDLHEYSYQQAWFTYTLSCQFTMYTYLPPQSDISPFHFYFA